MNEAMNTSVSQGDCVISVCVWIDCTAQELFKALESREQTGNAFYIHFVLDDGTERDMLWCKRGVMLALGFAEATVDRFYPIGGDE